MTATYYPSEDYWTDVDEGWDPEWADETTSLSGTSLPSIEIVVILLAAGMAGLLIVAANLLPSRTSQPQSASFPIAPPVQQPEVSLNVNESIDTALSGSGGPNFFAAPYAEYAITQGAHGQSYGHLAIDIAAGKDVPIRSPINGEVTERFVDGIGNPVLVIENERFQVTLLHGKYSVGIGDALRAGSIVGLESNQGNTRDMQGRSCRGRDCGYHTHLNVFDKQQGQNINPLTLINNP